MKIAVIGAGAVGGVVAGAAAASGHDVVVCVRTPIDVLTIAREGRETTVDAAFVTSAEGPPADIVFVTVKATDTPSIAQHLLALCDTETLTVVVQNGVDQGARVLSLLPPGAGPAIGANAYVAAHRTGAGRIHHISGDLLIVPADHASRVAAGVEGGLRVRGSHDMVTETWRKMLANLVGNPLTAITMRQMDVLQSPGMPDVVRAVLGEAIAVAQAEGAALDDRDLEVIAAGVAKYGAETGSSMLYDRRDGRPMEHQFLTGEVVRRGAAHRIATPVNTTILALLDAVEHEGQTKSRGT
jgi:2-dehydropantoate 2-reductase